MMLSLLPWDLTSTAYTAPSPFHSLTHGTLKPPTLGCAHHTPLTEPSPLPGVAPWALPAYGEHGLQTLTQTRGAMFCTTHLFTEQPWMTWIGAGRVLLAARGHQSPSLEVIGGC